MCISYVLQPEIQSKNSCVDSVLSFEIRNSHADSVTWLFGDGNIKNDPTTTVEHVYVNPGAYLVSAILHYPYYCDTIIDEVKIYQLQKPSLGNDTLLCLGEKYILSVSPPANGFVVWNHSDSSDVYEVSQGQTITVSVSNEYCSEFDSLKVYYIDCGFEVDSVCYGDSTLLSVKEQSVDSVKFGFGDSDSGVSANSSIKHRYNVPQNYLASAVIFKNGLVKQLETNFEIVYVDTAFLKDTLVGCEELYIEPDLSGFNYVYRWDNGKTSETIISEIEKWNVLQILKEGCTSKDSVYSLLNNCGCKVFIPNSFSPNGDGLNEKFYAWSECELSEVSLNIYNTWGEQLISNENEWDGTYLNNWCDPGVYLWTISYKNGKEIVYTAGTINLIR